MPRESMGGFNPEEKPISPKREIKVVKKKLDLKLEDVEPVNELELNLKSSTDKEAQKEIAQQMKTDRTVERQISDSLMNTHKEIQKRKQEEQKKAFNTIFKTPDDNNKTEE